MNYDDFSMFCVNGTVWLIDFSNRLATMCTAETYNAGDFQSIPVPTRNKYVEYLICRSYNI